MHTLIVGQTESGKSLLAKQICRSITKAGYGTIVFDPIAKYSERYRSEWNCEFLSSDFEEFYEVCKTSQNCYIFIDEGSENMGHFDKDNFWFATQSRHWGHSVYFISQRSQTIAKTVRTQCSALMLFSVWRDDAKDFAAEFNCSELQNAKDLQKGEYYYIKRHEKPVKKQLIFQL